MKALNMDKMSQAKGKNWNVSTCLHAVILASRAGQRVQSRVHSLAHSGFQAASAPVSVVDLRGEEMSTNLLLGEQGRRAAWQERTLLCSTLPGSGRKEE